MKYLVDSTLNHRRQKHQLKGGLGITVYAVPGLAFNIYDVQGSTEGTPKMHQRRED